MHALLLVIALAQSAPAPVTAPEPSTSPRPGVFEEVFGIKLTETETKVVGMMFAAAFGLITLAMRGGRKADEQTKSRGVEEDADTKSLTMRDLMVETLRSSGKAVERASEAADQAGDAATKASAASESCSSLGAQIERNHSVMTDEVKRLDGRIDGVLEKAATALSIARAAAGTRESDAAVRAAAVAAAVASTDGEGGASC